MALRDWSILAVSALSAALPFTYAQLGSGGGSVSYSFGYSDFIPGKKGIPFSAEFVSTTVRTLADGTHITEEQKRFEVRDSQGRTRNESYLPDSVAKVSNQPNDQPMFITIVDPVSGRHIHLNPQQKTATVNSMQLPQRLPPQRVTAPQPMQTPPPRPAVQSSKESLGGKTIDGVYAEGTRITRVYPAGTQGNDRDITVVMERWVSPDLGLEVYSKTNDPRNGETTMEVHNLNGAEPDPALFEIPDGYKVQTPDSGQKQ